MKFCEAVLRKVEVMKKQKILLSFLIVPFFVCFVCIWGINRGTCPNQSCKNLKDTTTRACFFDPALTDLLSCFNTTDTDPFCMQTNAFFMTDRRSHNAPVQSVAWLTDSPIGTYAAIGGFPENNIVGGVDARIYKFDADNGLLGNPIANLVHGSYVFGVSWVYIFDYEHSYDYGAYLAVGGYPSSIDDNEIHIYHLNSLVNPPAVNQIPVASYKHGAPIKSVSWLNCSMGDTAYLAIGGQEGTDGAEIRVLKFKASDNSLTLLANRFHGATINSVSWFYDPIVHPTFPPVLAVGGDPVPGVPVSGPNYITIRLYTFNCAKEALQDLIFGSQPSGSTLEPSRVFGVKPAVLNINDEKSGLFVGVACGSTITSLPDNTHTPGYLLALFPPTGISDASLESVASFAIPGIATIPVNGYTVDFNRSCTCEGIVSCCPQITFGLGCPKDIVGPLPLNIFTVGINLNGVARAFTKFDDNITSLEWYKSDSGKANYLLVGSESNDWNLNSFCGGNEIAVYRALIVCKSFPEENNIFGVRGNAVITETSNNIWGVRGNAKIGGGNEQSAWGQSCLCAHKECRRFPLQSDLSNVLNWTAISGAVAYYLYTFTNINDFVVASMPQLKQILQGLTLVATYNTNTCLTFRHHCLQTCQKVNYLLTAKNAAGVESPVAVIQI